MSPDTTHRSVRTETPPAATPAASLAGRLLERSAAHPGRVAYGRRNLGIWAEVTWRDYALEVRRAVSALRALGVGAGDRVLVMGDSRSEFGAVLIAAQLLRAACACAYPATGQRDLSALVGLLAPVVCIGETADDHDLLACSVQESDPAPAARPDAITARPALLVLERGAGRPELASWPEKLAAVEPIADAELAALARAVQADDPAYVSLGTDRSGPARAVTVDHAAAFATWSALLERLPRISSKDTVLADIPAAHPAGLAAAVILPLWTECRPFFTDDPRQAWLAATEIQPTVRVATARSWRALGSAVYGEIQDAGWLARRLFAVLGVLPTVRSAESAPGLAARLADQAVGAPLRHRLGLRKVRVALAMGGPLSRPTAALWRALGLAVDEVVDPGPHHEIGSPLRDVEAIVESSPYVRRCVAVATPNGRYAYVLPRTRVVEAELRRRGGAAGGAASAEAFLATTALAQFNASLAAAGQPELAGVRLLEADLAPPDLTPDGVPTDALRRRLADQTDDPDPGRP